MTTVSVIVPVLDAQRYLDEAIASVAAQTLTDWELLLVDDGSRDRSLAIAQRAAANDPRVRLLANRGARRSAAAARNIGLRAAVGRYVAFLDADDVYHPHQLESLAGAFDQHPGVAFVYGPTHWWYPDDPSRDWVEPMDRIAGRVHRPPELLNRVVLLQRGHVPCTCSVMVARAAALAVDGFEEDFQLYEDQTLWAKLLLRFPAYVTDRVGARYRQHDSATSARAAREGQYDRMRAHGARHTFLAWTGEYARRHELDAPSVQRALRRSLSVYPDGRAGLTPVDRAALLLAKLSRRVGARWRRALR